MALRRLLGPLAVVALVLVPTPSRAMDSLESQVFSLINGERSTPLIEHSGLLAAARQHSQEMAMAGGLNHDGADERVANAPPDPPEANGPPDDGFATAAWCENVTYSNGFPASQVAQRIYEQWHSSGAHDGCMANPEKNVGAVGIYYDGTTWWATFIAEVDHTPPGAAASPPPPSPHTSDARPAPAPAGPSAVSAPTAEARTPTAERAQPTTTPTSSPVATSPSVSASGSTVGGKLVTIGLAATGSTQPRFEVFVQPLTDDFLPAASRRTGHRQPLDRVESAAFICIGLIALRWLDRRRLA